MLAMRIEGLAQLQARFRGVNFRPALRTATLAIAHEIENYVAPYAPETAANMKPGWFVIGGGKRGNRWYERGYGTKWLRKDGSVGGRKTSQVLNRQWNVQRHGDIGAVLNNKASYGLYVHGADQQASFHAAHNWRTDEAGVKHVSQTGAANKIANAAIDNTLRRAGLI